MSQKKKQPEIYNYLTFYFEKNLVYSINILA